MATQTTVSTEVSALRREMKRYGVELSLKHARELFRVTGNKDLCVDALLMENRPAWLKELLAT